MSLQKKLVQLVNRAQGHAPNTFAIDSAREYRAAAREWIVENVAPIVCVCKNERLVWLDELALGIGREILNDPNLYEEVNDPATKTTRIIVRVFSDKKTYTDY